MKHRPKAMSQQQCADLAGVDVDTVGRYERGGNVSIEVERKILKACGKKKVVTDINS